MPSETFLKEVEEIDEVLEDARTRLKALHDLAIYEELHPAAAKRAKLKCNTIDLVRSQVAEIPDLATNTGAGR